MTPDTHAFAAKLLAGRASRFQGVRVKERCLVPSCVGTSRSEIVLRLRVHWREVWTLERVTVVVHELGKAGALKLTSSGWRVVSWERVALVARRGGE